MTEIKLIASLKNPNTLNSAFKELINQYKERLYWHVRKIVINHDDTDDVLQNIFIKIYRNIHKFNGDSKLYSWMYRIATNEAITFINQRARKNNSVSEEVQKTLINNLTSDEYFDGDEVQIKLLKAIATLPQKQQIVFNMKYFDAIKYKEMSEILDTSEGALKASFHIASKKIKEYLLNN
jgi:RNA polymerase sigma-70 factor (ECF subfamily)|tara:strand:- start:665 stop:1204 length:540 start_codon:yes stop_codon:yes gene_type:complete